MLLRQGTALIAVAWLCGAVAYPVAPSAQVASSAQDESDQVVIDDPRPLAAAALELEHRCHCVITYEDIKWTQSEVADVPGVTKRAPNTPRLQVPRGLPFTVTLERRLSAAAPAQMNAAFQAVFDAFKQAGNPGVFRVVSSAVGFNIVPRDGALFDVPISIPVGRRSLAQLLPDMLATVGAASGNRDLLARAPVNWLMQTSAEGGASGDRFGEVLTRVLSSGRNRLSWRLLYDFGMEAYYVNLHNVH